MTQDQVMGLLRQLLPAIGALALVLGVSQTTVSYWTNLILQIAGPISIVVGVIWSLVANSKKSILTSAANMPEVKEITIDKTAPAASELAGAGTPNNVIAK